MVGYCPQSNAIFEELTGREMLLLTATLRGLKQREQHVDKWILIFGKISCSDIFKFFFLSY